MLTSPHRLIHQTAVRLNEDDSSKKYSSDDQTNDDPTDQRATLPIPSLVALAPLQIPEFLPRVPVIAITRNPLFPNFIKMLEVRILKKINIS